MRPSIYPKTAEKENDTRYIDLGWSSVLLHDRPVILWSYAGTVAMLS
jgi:hypothetical protein